MMVKSCDGIRDVMWLTRLTSVRSIFYNLYIAGRLDINLLHNNPSRPLIAVYTSA